MLFIQNTKSSGCFNQAHNGFLYSCDTGNTVWGQREPALHYFFTGASTLNPSNMVDYDPGCNLASSQRRLTPEWLMERCDGAVICSGTERCYCRGCSLLIGHDGDLRCGSAGVCGRWLLSAPRPVSRSCRIWFLCVETVAVSSGVCKWEQRGR